MSGKSIYFIAEQANDKSDVKKIKRELDTIRGVTSVSVNAERSLVGVDYDDNDTGPDEIGSMLENMGYQIRTGMQQDPH